MRRPSFPVRAAGAVLLLTLALVAGCGSGRHRTAAEATTTAAAPAARAQDCLSARRRGRALQRTRRDAAVLRRLAAPLGRSRMGTPALQAATARFLVHLDTSGLAALTRNRLIDEAAAAVAFACEQCFQMLEAERPIPALYHGSAPRCP